MTHRLWLLLIFHLVSGILFSAWSALEGRIPFVLEAILIVPPFALVFSQSSLLALWAVMSPAARWVRIVGWIAGSVYLAFLLRWAIDERGDEAIPITLVVTLIVTVTLFIVRQRNGNLRRISGQREEADRSGLQFSIRGLMIFTLAVAVLIAAAKQLRGTEASKTDALILCIWGVCFVVTGLASIWATLGLSSPYARSIAVLIISAMLGWCFSYGVASDWETYVYVMIIMFLQTALLVGSLLVVRS
jgi:hypothetical protein